MNDYVVVIPSRNRYEFALRAIRSALNQTIPPVEVYLVDDASTDRRYDWIEEIVDDARLTMIRRKVPSRVEWQCGFAVGCVRNEALWLICKQEKWDGWVAFLDDDDEWMPEKTSVQLQAAKDHGARVICSNAYNRSRTGVVMGFHHGEHGRQIGPSVWDVTAILHALNPVINSTGMLHHDVAREVGLQKPNEFGEDWLYWQQAAMFSPVLRVDEPLALYTLGNSKEYEL